VEEEEEEGVRASKMGRSWVIGRNQPGFGLKMKRMGVGEERERSVV
jgi:hypothetical protein